jgi:acetyltransferase-like isoleucine patch superfamily enzyme
MKALKEIGPPSIIHRIDFFNLYRTGFRGLKIGCDCFLGDGVLLDLADAIDLGNKVTLAERVTVLTHTNAGYHDHPLQAEFPVFSRPVKFEDRCFVGACIAILSGVRIGTCSFVAAGSVVSGDVPGRHLVAGVPAGRIRALQSGPRRPRS